MKIDIGKTPKKPTLFFSYCDSQSFWKGGEITEKGFLCFANRRTPKKNPGSMTHNEMIPRFFDIITVGIWEFFKYDGIDNSKQIPRLRI